MMRTWTGDRVVGWRNGKYQTRFEKLTFRDCYFESCDVGMTRDPESRVTIKDVVAINCKQKGCIIGPAVFENVSIEGLGTGGQLLQAWGAAFKNVVLSGKIDRVMLSPIVVLNDRKSPVNLAFRSANAEIYGTVDWALDIRGAEAKELEIQGVPSKLIRRDPETQVVVKAAKALEGDFKSLDFGDTHWAYSIQLMLERGEEDVVLVAPKRSPKFKGLLAALTMLRREGIAESD